MKVNHAPDPGFINSLEQQLTSELRRRRRFGPADRSTGLKRFIRTAILIVSCTVAGVAAAKTVEHLESSRRKALNMARAETAMELARARKEMVRDMLQQVEQRVEAGLLSADELADNVLQSELVHLELKKAWLDLEEVSATGEAPADELYAPVQGKRDFVTERLCIEYQRTAAIEAHLKARMVHTEKLMEEGLVSRAETLDLRTQLERAAEECTGIQGRIDLRTEFLAGDLTARQVSLRQMLHDAKVRLEIAENIYHTVSVQLEEAKKANADGLIHEHEVKQAEYQMISARAEYRIAKLELVLLEEKLGE